MAVFRRLAIPKCLCARSAAVNKTEVECTCPRHETYSVQFRYRGRQIFRETEFTVKAKAERFEDGLRRGLRSDREKEVWEFFEGMRRRRAVCSIGDLCEAVLHSKEKFRKTDKDTRRIVNDLLLVIAHALDLWTTESRSQHSHWQKKGTKPRPDRDRIYKLSSTVLDGALVKKYFEARSVDGVVDWVEQREENTSVNSTLGHARDMFRGKVRLAIEALALDEDKLEKFMKHPMLPEPSPIPEPVEGEVYQKMIEGAEKLRTDTTWRDAEEPFAARRCRRGIYLANLAIRQTGLRVGSVLHLHKDWLRMMNDGWWLHVKVRKGGTAEYSLPVSDALKDALMDSSTGYLLPGDTEEERAAVLQAHNDWLKGIIGGQGERKQGAHRLRDTVAGIARVLWGLEVAMEVLGHADSTTTKKHYTRLRVDVSDLMKQECAALAKLKGR